MTEAGFKERMRKVRAAVIGARFRAVIVESARGPQMVKKTIVHLAAQRPAMP